MLTHFVLSCDEFLTFKRGVGFLILSKFTCQEKKKGKFRHETNSEKSQPLNQ